MNKYIHALNILEREIPNKYLKEGKTLICASDEYKYSVYLMKRLVDKQIPILMDESGHTSMCPKCNSGVYGVGINYTDRDFFYCPVCGQKLSLKGEDYK